VLRRRDLGGLIFIDLRDRSGLVQIHVDEEAGDCYRAAEKLRNEYVIKVEGVVRARPEGTSTRIFLRAR